MGLQLPGELATFLNIIGYDWPQADEERLFEACQTFLGFGGTLQSITADATKAASAVWDGNVGNDISAFAAHWHDEDGPARILDSSSTASTLIGAGMAVCAAIVLALKVQVIVQLVTLAIQIAQAIASAVVTFGASLAEIPIFQQITRILVGKLIDQVIGRLLNA
jgi:hypothetical protein